MGCTQSARTFGLFYLHIGVWTFWGVVAVLICADHRHHFSYKMNYDAQNKSPFRVG